MEFKFDFVPKVLEYFYLFERTEFTYDADTYASYALFAPESGSFTYESENKTFIATAGELIICPPGVLFKRKIVSLLNLHFIRFEADGGITPPTRPIKLAIENKKRLEDDYRLLKSIDPTPEAYGLISHILKDMLLLFLLQREKSPEVPIKTDDEIINKALKYIYENAFAECSFKKLADMLHLSPVQLIRRFRQQTGTSPSAMLFSLRIEKACRLLRDTDYTLSEIAPLCGYENEFYFSRIFKKKTGESPSDYRKRNRTARFTVL